MNQHSREPLYKTILDFVSATCVIYFFGCYAFINLTMDRLRSSHTIPVYVWLLYLDFFPTVFGICWLTGRRPNSLDRYIPFVAKDWFKWSAVILIALSNVLGAALSKVPPSAYLARLFH